MDGTVNRVQKKSLCVINNSTTLDNISTIYIENQLDAMELKSNGNENSIYSCYQGTVAALILFVTVFLQKAFFYQKIFWVDFRRWINNSKNVYDERLISKSIVRKWLWLFKSVTPFFAFQTIFFPWSHI